MHRFFLGPIAALVLAGCMTAEQTAVVDANIQSTLAAVCPVAQQAHAAFVVAAVNSDRVARYADEERQAYAAISVACNNPGAVNSSNFLIYVATAYAAWEVAGALG